MGSARKHVMDARTVRVFVFGVHLQTSNIVVNIYMDAVLLRAYFYIYFFQLFTETGASRYEVLAETVC